ncbi:hypothetical protein KBB68_03130 [Candidatus Babeliales bacterium]|nr:hypothetical protein [Candidatus Babeliales bacterium]
MIDRRFIALFIISFSIVLFSGLLWMKLFYIEQNIATLQEDIDKDSSSYKDIELVIPVQEFLKRGANSLNLSTVKRIFVNQWIYFNQNDLIKLIIYAQGAASFDEMKKGFEAGIKSENAKNGAATFIQSCLTTIANDPKLISYVDNSLKNGLNQELHALRGKMMETEYNSREYKRLKIEYRKALYAWINEQHGKLLDELVLQL